MTKEYLKKRVKELPTEPGIYKFLGPNQKCLYIGKALNLKNRLNSYLKTEDVRIRKMVSLAESLKFQITGSDIEALILESQLIKKSRPEFNIVMRDDKQYFYVGFTNDQFPKIFLTHQPREVSSIKEQVLRGSGGLNTKYLIPNTYYIGPFTDGSAIKTTLRLLRRIFPYCTCKQLHNNYCLNYHIEKCPGFCCLKDNPERSRRTAEFATYKKNIKSVKDILSGKRSSVLANLEKDMGRMGSQGKFEEALELRNKIGKIKRVFQNAQILLNSNRLETEVDTTKETLALLKKQLGLSKIPDRIEAYDISNIHGTNAVGSMVVFTKGYQDKNEYRKFKIISKNTSDDTGMLKEVLSRRFNHPEWPYPDLILIDGGKGQLNAGISVIPKNIKIISMAKNDRHVGEKIFIAGQKEPIFLSKMPTDVKNTLLRIDSEAHRFAISFYRTLHRKLFR